MSSEYNYTPEQIKESNSRLLQLANHLESDKLGHKEFSFLVINSDDPFKTKLPPLGRSCGTYGCALGELPIVFPREWIFFGAGLSYDENLSMEDTVTEFFSITSNQMYKLFYPSEDCFKVTKEDVAACLKYFVESRVSNLS